MISLKELYASKEDCCGCELCSLACNRNVLSMQPDSNGFLYPNIINPAACIDCKRCIIVCPQKNSVRASRQFIRGYGGYAKDEKCVRKSASGGLSYTIGKKIIERGGLVYGVAYDADCRMARYIRVTNLKELERTRSSKYFQSQKHDIYVKIKKDLQNGIDVLFVGLPCEVSALYNFLSKDYKELYTISLMCHGTTSPRVHQEFCDALQNEYKSQLRNFTVRYKLNGWKPYYIKADFENGQVFYDKFINTDYEVAFKYLKRPSCTSCKFKLRNEQFGFKADMVIGDFHGAKSTDPFYNVWGASKFYVTSEKGEYLKNIISEELLSSEISLKSIYTGSPVLNYPTRKLLFSSYYSWLISKYSLHRASSNLIIRFAINFILPFTKTLRSYLQRICAKLLAVH